MYRGKISNPLLQKSINDALYIICQIYINYF